MAGERRVIWSIESSYQIESIKKFILKEWSKKEVNIFFGKLKKFENLVSRFPKLYQASIKYPNLRKAVVTKHQSVIYELDGILKGTYNFRSWTAELSPPFYKPQIRR